MQQIYLSTNDYFILINALENRIETVERLLNSFDPLNDSHLINLYQSEKAQINGLKRDIKNQFSLHDHFENH
jgi:hypothetical protein